MFSQDIIWVADLALVLVMSVAGFAAMGVDKSIAKGNEKREAKGKKPRRRIRERTLFLLALLGGSPGVLLGMYVFRHKTKHRSFVLGIPAILILQVALGWFLFHRLSS
jgi:uncharacterized membrane protein YsdA (DUF1294 family)